MDLDAYRRDTQRLADALLSWWRANPRVVLRYRFPNENVMLAIPLDAKFVTAYVAMSPDLVRVLKEVDERTGKQATLTMWWMALEYLEECGTGFLWMKTEVSLDEYLEAMKVHGGEPMVVSRPTS